MNDEILKTDHIGRQDDKMITNTSVNKVKKITSASDRFQPNPD